VHCSERGELLGRLGAFYMRSTDATARLAERSVRIAYEDRLGKLEAHVHELEAQLKEARAAAGHGANAEQVAQSFRTLPLPDQKDTLYALMAESGHTLLCDDDGDPLPPDLQAEHIASTVFVHHRNHDEFREVYAALAARQTAADRRKLFQALLGAVSDDEKFELLFDNLDTSQRNHMIKTAFTATADKEKGALLADMMHEMKRPTVNATLADALAELERSATTSKGGFLASLLSTVESPERPPLVGGLLAYLDVPTTSASVTVGVQKWTPAEATGLAHGLLLALPKKDCVTAFTQLLDKLKAADRRTALSAIISHSVCASSLSLSLPVAAVVAPLGCATMDAPDDEERCGRG
jgi:hypothetical protein